MLKSKTKAYYGPRGKGNDVILDNEFIYFSYFRSKLNLTSN